MHIASGTEGAEVVSPRELGGRIERARQLARMSQADLARRLECDQSTISRLEAGRGITSNLLSRIAEATGQNLDFFLRPELPVELLLRTSDPLSATTSEAVAAFGRFISDYEFLLDLDE